MHRWGEKLFFLRNAIAGSWLGWVASVLTVLMIVAVSWTGTTSSQVLLKTFGGTISGIGELRLEHPEQRAGEISGALFLELANSRWLEFDRATARLELRADCDALALGFRTFDLRQARSPREEPDTARSVARKLCRSDPGTTVREEVDLWNQKTTVVAVRDDRDANRPCENGMAQDTMIPEGCHGGAWQASFAMAAMGTAAAPTLSGETPPGASVFLRGALHAGFGSWQRFDGSAARDSSMILRTTVPFAGTRQRTITVDVLGDLVSADWRDAAQAQRDPASAGAPPRNVAALCDKPAVARRNCKDFLSSTAGRNSARGSRITFQIDSPRAIELRVVVKPAPAVERRIAALAQARFRTPEPGEVVSDDVDRTISLTDQIVARCNMIDPAVIAYDVEDESELRIPASLGEAPREVRVCMLDWITRKPVPASLRRQPPGGPVIPVATATVAAATAAEPGTLTVRLGGAEPLALTKAVTAADPAMPGKTRTAVVPTDEAKALALLPLIGTDDKDAGSLIGQLRPRVPSGGNRDLELTIDARLQRIAFDHLRGLMTRQPAFRDINTMMETKYDGERRGAIVLLDGGRVGSGGYDEDAGRILAAASWPQVAPGISESDLRAVEKLYPSRSPLAARAWAQNDRFNAPGSSIKPVIALAAIDRAARGDNTIADMLGAEPPDRIGLNAAGIQRTLGNQYGFSFTTDKLVVPVGAGRPREGTHSITTGSGPLCADVPGDCRGNGRVRMHDMLIRSDNIWFARMALALDEDAVSTVGANGRRSEIGPRARTDAPPSGGPPLAVARMVSRLWPDQAANILPSDNVRRFSRLQATPIQLDARDESRPRLLSVALNGIGQSAQATPLAMASIMSSIATGRIVLPRLTPQDDPRRTARGLPLLNPEDVDGKRLDQGRAEAMVDRLRRALSDVVRSGTAAPGFRGSSLLDRVYGKTGTAQSDEMGGPDTVWFVGWLEGLAMPGLEARRIGFACMLTHANPEDSAGGRTCAPLMRKLFERIEPPRPAAAAKGAR